MLFGPKAQGYPVKSFVDNLYLNWPAGNEDLTRHRAADPERVP